MPLNVFPFFVLFFLFVLLWVVLVCMCCIWFDVWPLALNASLLWYTFLSLYTYFVRIRPVVSTTTYVTILSVTLSVVSILETTLMVSYTCSVSLWWMMSVSLVRSMLLITLREQLPCSIIAQNRMRKIKNLLIKYRIFILLFVTNVLLLKCSNNKSTMVKFSELYRL